MIVGIMSLKKGLDNMKNKDKLLKMMKELGMNKSTITGVMELATTQEIIDKTIDYIVDNKKILTDHQLRQYMVQILLWDKE